MLQTSDFYKSLSRLAFPKCLLVEDFIVISDLLAYAATNSADEERVLKYIYNTYLTEKELLPKSADTLGFNYPIGYPLEQLRVILEYYRKILKKRGTIKSIKQIIRLLNVSEDDIIRKDIKDYAEVIVEEVKEGFLLIKYDGIIDESFTEDILLKVVPAGNDFRLESTEKGPKRYRMDFLKFNEKLCKIEFIVSDSASVIEFGIKEYAEFFQKQTYTELHEVNVNGGEIFHKGYPKSEIGKLSERVSINKV